jgi:hypothetical protein
MNSTPDFIEYVCEQIAGVGAVLSFMNEIVPQAARTSSSMLLGCSTWKQEYS